MLLCLALPLLTQAQVERVGITPQPQVAQPTGPPGTPVIAGQTRVAQGTASTPYTAAITGTTGTIGNWSISNSAAGTITSSGATATVHWTSSFSGTVAIYCTATNSYGSTPSLGYAVSVTPATPAIVAGTIIPASQTLNIGGTISTITVTGISGGTGTYTYQWQSSVDNTNWTNVTTAPNATSYSPGTATGPVYYRLGISSGSATPVYTASSSVLISGCTQLNTVPTSTMNYITSSTFREAGVTSSVTDAQIAAMGICSVNQTIEYLDGLGRPIQTVAVKASQGGNDVIQPMAYDQYGREATKYLPYTDGTAIAGSYRSNALQAGTGQAAFYNPAGSSGTQQSNGIVRTDMPSASTNFEPSPLNRVVEQGAPGDAWQLSNSGVSGSGHTVITAYGTNASEVILWNINSNGNGATGNTIYAPGMLYKTTTTDENGNSSIEYKDKQGLVVCKMVVNGTISLATYYVYDDLNNLTYVIPPIPTSATNPGTPAYPNSFLETDPVFLNFIYGYHYDSRNRLIQNKIPGKGWQFMVYNSLDQLVLSQNAVQQAANQWTVTKYDAQGRIIVTGLWNAGSTIPQPTLQASIYAAAQWDIRDVTNNHSLNSTGYVISSYPALSKVLTINYYDDYSFTGQPATVLPPTSSSVMTRSLPTATLTTVLNTINNASPDMLWKVNYYDDLGRTTQTYAQHYFGGSLSPYNYDVVTNSYDFANEVTATNRQHYNTTNTSSQVATIANSYIYDNEGRKKQTWEQVNNGTNVLLVDNEYNEIGQLMTKNLYGVDGGGAGYQANITLNSTIPSGQTTVIATNSITLTTGFSVTGSATTTFTAQIAGYLQPVNYTYNERGWLLSNTAPLFQEQLQYNDLTTEPGLVAASLANYNGNISSQTWKTGTAATSSSYVYGYDALNRLTSGTNTATNNTESNISYDAMGNILSLNRYQTGTANPIDQLQYTYTVGGNYTNQVQTINDISGNNLGLVNGTTNYTIYDLNGNLHSSSNMTNSSQNKTITYNMLNLPITYTLPAGTVTYTYDADGSKLRKVSQINGTTTTTDYIGGIQYNNGAISFIQTEEGRALNNGGVYNYEYALTDHLGNSRVNFTTTNGSAVLVQSDDYYPFGMEILGPNVDNPKNDYLYNKKELQEEFAQYDYGARFYDPVIARWTTIDPLAEKSRKFSPYNYAIGNPIRFIDPDGKEIINIPGGVRLTEEDAKIAFSAIKQQAESNKPFNIHFVYESKTKEIYKNTLNAFRQGKPQVLHYDNDRQRQQARRTAATSAYPAATGLSKDEYPYASTFEGGAGAVVANVPLKEQFSQGGSLSALYRTMTQGEAFVVIPVPRDKEPDEYPESVTQPSFKPTFPVLPLPTQVPLPNVPLPEPTPTFEIPEFFAL